MSTDTAPLRPGLATLLIVTGLLAGGPAAGQESGRTPLPLREALALARENDPDVVAARNDVQVADWEVRDAYGSLLPSVSASSTASWQGAGEQQIGSLTTQELGFPDQPSFYFSTYDLSLAYTLDGALLTAPGRAKANRSAALARTRDREARLVEAVTGAYLDVLRHREELALARQELERARAHLELAEARREVGTATELEARRARVEVGRARAGVLRAENGVRTARLALRRQIGIPPSDDTLELTTRFELFEPPWTEEYLYDRAVERNPGLAALRASRRAADSRVSAARSAYYPSVTVQAGIGGFTREATDPSIFVEQARRRSIQQVEQCQALNELFLRLSDPLPPQDCSSLRLSAGEADAIVDRNDTFPFDFTRRPARASLTVSVPLFQGLGRQRELEAARVEREDLRLRIRDRELAVRTDIASGLAAVRTAYETARLEEENEEVADAQLRLAREQYRVGRIPFVELVEAETVKARAARERTAALYAFHEAMANLEAVVGTSLRADDGPEER